MRYIDIEQLDIPAQWRVEADRALTELRGAPPEQRAGTLDRYQPLWRALKVELHKLSRKKCWYCETIEVRADDAVDHYRPKGNVKDADPPHSGYWWLAFDWRNYRFSCTFCNSLRRSPTTVGGKQDYFPLSDEKRRARCEADNTQDEDPLLLDPTNPLDVLLLAFSEDGCAGPAPSPDHAIDHLKGVKTVERYHLNHPWLVEMRLARMKEVRRWVEEADQQLQRHARGGDPQHRANAVRRIQEIMRAVTPAAPYSSAVRHLLAGLKGISDAAKAALIED